MISGAGHVILTEARRHVWALRPEVWDSFSRVLSLDVLPVAATAPPKPRRSSSREPGVAVIPLQGLITPKLSMLSMLFGGSGLHAFRENLAAAAADDEVSAIVLDVDSPGGSSAMVEETATAIQAARVAKPVISAVNCDAGSGAYWLAAQADEITITPSGMVGSIGAFILHLDQSGLNEKMGVEPTYISAGRFKVEGNPDEPLTDQAHEHLQELVDETHATFVRDVARGRGVTEKAVRQGFGEGRMVTAERALEAGMVDRIEPLESTVGRLLTQSSSPSAIVPGAHESELEEPTGSRSLSKVSRQEDEALADSAIASLTR